VESPSRPAPSFGRTRRRLARAIALGVGAAGASWSFVASAGGAASTDEYDDIDERALLDVHALADAYLQYRLDAPGAPFLRAFDTRSDAPSLEMVRLTLAHRPDVVGFRLDLAAGDTANTFLHYDPAATSHPNLSRGLSYVEQGFFSARVPVGRGLLVDVGKYSTPVGFEDNETLQNWNYSRSLLFTYAEPTYHFGARVLYPVSKDLAVAAFWTNGWNTNVLDGSDMRTGAAAVTWKILAGLEVSVVYMGGPERATRQLNDASLAARNEFDAYATWAPTARLTFATTMDYGADAHGSGSSFWGVAGYGRVQLLPFLACAVRGEQFADPGGFTTGMKQRIAELTSTVEARTVVTHVTLLGRLEYRRDQSDHVVFGPHARQDTLTSSAVVAF
jgi:hypothetical protein